MFLLIILVVAFCANSLVQGGNLRNAESKSDLNSELIAPLQSSLSQYYQPPALLNIQLLKQQQEQLQQPQTLAQILGLQNHHLPANTKQQIAQPIQQTQINPFLYLGQLLDTGENNSNKFYSQSTPQNPQQKKRNDEQDTQSQERNSYVLYRPSADEEHQFVDMTPPAESQNEPNYYVMLTKPRKFKKYAEEDLTEVKLKARKENDKLKHQIKRSETSSHDDSKDDTEAESTDYVEKSEPTSRLDFQMHGHKGPKSYKFGFDYGSDHGLNRQFRVEERDTNGDVHGKYGYFDRKGKLRVVKYSSTAKDGFKVHQ